MSKGKNQNMKKIPATDTPSFHAWKAWHIVIKYQPHGILCHRMALKRFVAHLASVAGPDDAQEHDVANVTLGGRGVVVLLKPARVA